MYHVRFVVTQIEGMPKSEDYSIGKDETMIQAIARMQLWANNTKWEVTIVDHNKSQFTDENGDTYEIEYIK